MFSSLLLAKNLAAPAIQLFLGLFFNASLLTYILERLIHNNICLFHEK
jgi:hypothetical protein